MNFNNTRYEAITINEMRKDNHPQPVGGRQEGEEEETFTNKSVSESWMKKSWDFRPHIAGKGASSTESETQWSKNKDREKKWNNNEMSKMNFFN